MTRGEFTQLTVQGIQADVDRFMQAMGQDTLDRPGFPSDPVIDLRIDLITEEFDETIDALVMMRLNPGMRSVEGLARLADGIADLMYVVIGTGSAFGIDLEPVWEEVQRTNMSKTTGPVRADGKRLKPEGWEPPDLVRIIKNQIDDGWDPEGVFTR